MPYVLIDSRRGERIPIIEKVEMLPNGIEYEKEGWGFEEAKLEVVRWLTEKAKEIGEMKEEDFK